MPEFRSLSGIPEKIGKEWISLAYLRAICAQAGLNIFELKFDNGIDLDVGSSKPINKVCSANTFISLQLKATKNWAVDSNDNIKYDIPIKNYNQLRVESVQAQYLILFTLPPEQNDWIKYQFEHDHEHVVEVRHMAYYHSLKGLPKVSNNTKVRIHIPSKNKLTSLALRDLFIKHSTEIHSWITNRKEA